VIRLKQIVKGVPSDGASIKAVVSQGPRGGTRRLPKVAEDSSHEVVLKNDLLLAPYPPEPKARPVEEVVVNLV